MSLASRVRTNFIAYTTYLKNNPLTTEQEYALQTSLQKIEPVTFAPHSFPSKLGTTLWEGGLKLRHLMVFPLICRSPKLDQT